MTSSFAGRYGHFVFSSWKNRLGYWLRARWPFLLTIVSSAIFVCSLATTPGRAASVLTWISAAITAASVYRGVRQLRAEARFSLETRPLEAALEKNLQDAGWRTLASHGRLAVYLDAVNAALPAARIRLVVSPVEYQLPRGVAAYRHVIMNKLRLGLVSNEDKVGQETDLDAALLRSPDVAVSVYKTNYHSGIFTNEMALRRLVEPKPLPRHSDVVIDGSQFFLEHGRLAPLALRRASNHIGVSTIAVFDDVEIPLVVQSGRSMQNRGQVVPSGSGSVDWRGDLAGADFVTFIARDMERELREELGLAGAIACKTCVVGFCRMVDRAGKPEYFGLTRVFSPIGVVRRTLFERMFAQRHARLEDIVGCGSLNPATHGDRAAFLLEKLTLLRDASCKRSGISITAQANVTFAADFVSREQLMVQDLLAPSPANRTTPPPGSSRPSRL